MLNMCHVHSWNQAHLRPIGGTPHAFIALSPRKLWLPLKGSPPSPQPSPQCDSMRFNVEKWESGKRMGTQYSVAAVENTVFCSLHLVIRSPQMDWWVNTAVIIVQAHSESFTPSISEIGEILKPLPSNVKSFS